MTFNRDRFNQANLRRSGNAAMAVVNALQMDFTPEEQFHGLVAAFLLLSEARGLPVQDAFIATKNLMNNADNKLRPEFKAVRQYVENEIDV